MIDTVIVSGGNIQEDFALDFLEKLQEKAGKGNLRLIAADKGLEFFMKTGIKPDIAVGDFDSLSREGREYLDKAADMEIKRLKPEKDDSDTQSAVNLAIDRGAQGIALLGTMGSRLDHMLANLGLLSFGQKKGVNIVMADAHNYVTLIQSGTVLHKSGQFGRFVSFFPVGGDVPGVVLEGFKYPLNGHYLTVSDSGLTVSNEIIQDEARVTFEKGSLLMIMSRD
ncbi:MAG: thiamine diphosphokinase [Eubacteriales bacterium]|nr:thiamine diphosphokinase [Eubacteriales bacterium]